MIVIIIIVITITQYSKFQFKICFNKVIGFLKKSSSLNTRFAAKTYPTVGEFLLVARNKEWFLKLHKGTLIAVIIIIIIIIIINNNANLTSQTVWRKECTQCGNTNKIFQLIANTHGSCI
jgi:hypothetical protein